MKSYFVWEVLCKVPTDVASYIDVDDQQVMIRVYYTIKTSRTATANLIGTVHIYATSTQPTLAVNSFDVKFKTQHFNNLADKYRVPTTIHGYV